MLPWFLWSSWSWGSRPSLLRNFKTTVELPPRTLSLGLLFFRQTWSYPCYRQLLAKGVEILDPPADQPRGHRTVYFADPEGNILEVYAEI